LIVREQKPPFNPEQVISEFAAIIKLWGASTVTADHYAGDIPKTAFQRHGILYLASEQTRSELYLELLPLMSSGKVELLLNPKLKGQLCGLERRIQRSGRESVDHAPGSHDDLINSAAGSLVLAAKSYGYGGPIRPLREF